MKKILAVLLALAVVFSFASCSKDEAATTTTTTATTTTSTTASDLKYDGVEITMWSMWLPNEPQGKVLQEAAEAFEAETGCKVTIEFRGRDLSTIIMTALEANEKVDLFEEDSMRIANTYAPYCLDLTEMAEAAGYADQSYAVFANDSIARCGYLVAIAEQPQVGGIWYNKDLFEKAGITELPTTWDEFMDMCQQLLDAGIAPMALDSTYADFNFGYHLDRYIGQAKTKELSLNGGWSKEPGVAAAAETIIDFVEAGYLAPGAPDEYPSGQNKLAFEQAAMVVCANYVTTEVDGVAAEPLNWGLMNYPVVPEDQGGSGSANAYAGANSIAVVKNSKNPQAAFDFALYLTSGEWDQKMATEAQQVPADPRNEEPAKLSGSIDALLASTEPLSWTGGINENSTLKTMLKEVIIQLFEGQYATGAEFAAAMDALY